jgi:hypothetical protein
MFKESGGFGSLHHQGDQHKNSRQAKFGRNIRVGGISFSIIAPLESRGFTVDAISKGLIAIGETKAKQNKGHGCAVLNTVMTPPLPTRLLSLHDWGQRSHRQGVVILEKEGWQLSAMLRGLTSVQRRY